MQDAVMAAQAGRPRHEARLRSAAGEHAGSWLAVFPLTRWTTARGRDYQLALCLWLGATNASKGSKGLSFERIARAF